MRGEDVPGKSAKELVVVVLVTVVVGDVTAGVFLIDANDVTTCASCPIDCCKLLSCCCKSAIILVVLSTAGVFGRVRDEH